VKIVREDSTRRKMRHSSWTLFLVPLALPLVLLLPGAKTSQGPEDPPAEAEYEQVRSQSVLSLQDLKASALGPEESHSEISEALFKD
jgi:hypothetical protein